MYVINDNLGFDFGAIINAAAPTIKTGVETYGQIQAIRQQPKTVTQLIPAQSPTVVYQQPAPVAAPQQQPKKSKVGQYLTIGLLVAVGLGGGVLFARRRSRR